MIGLVVAALGIRLAYYKSFASPLPLSGDEVFYFEKARAISNWIWNIFSYFDSTGAELMRIDLVERGWFLPGMSVVLSVPMIFAKLINGATFDVASLRLYIGTLNFVCLLLITHSVLKSFGSLAANVFLTMAAFFPAYIAFSFTFWGEVLASNMLLAYLIFMFRAFVGPKRRAYKVGILAGLWLSLLIYIRPNFLFMIPFTGILFTWAELKRAASNTCMAAMARAVGFSFLLCLTFLMLIAPWSYAVSKTHGGPYLTTTSTELAVVITYAEGGTRTSLLSHNEAIPSLWYRLYETYSQEAKATGRSYSEVSKGYRDRVLRETKLTEYTKAVRLSLRDMFFQENQFLQRFSLFLQNGKGEHESGDIAAAFNLFSKINSVLWYLTLSAAFLIMILPWRISENNLAYSILFRIAFLSLAIQPFLFGTSGRYYVSMILLCFFALACVAQRLAEQRHGLGRASELSLEICFESVVFPLITLTSLAAVFVLR